MTDSPQSQELPWLQLDRDSERLTTYTRKHGSVVPIPTTEIDLVRSPELMTLLEKSEGLLFLTYGDRQVGSIAMPVKLSKSVITIRATERACRQKGYESERGLTATIGRVRTETGATPEAIKNAENKIRRFIRTEIRKELSPQLKELWRGILVVHSPVELADRASGRTRKGDLEYQGLLEERRLIVRLNTVLQWLRQLRAEQRSEGLEFLHSLPQLSKRIVLLESAAIWRKSLRDARNGDSPSGTLRSNPLVYDGRLFVSIWSPGRLKALDAENGRVLWSRHVPKYADRPFVVGGNILCSSSQQLFSFNPETGRQNWRYEPYQKKREWFYSEPVSNGKEVCFCDNDGVIHCLEVASGRVKWLAKASEKGYCSTPFMTDQSLVTVSRENQLKCHRLADGALEWGIGLVDSWVDKIQQYQDLLLINVKTGLTAVNSSGEVVRDWTWPNTKIANFCAMQKMLIVDLEASDQAGFLIGLEDGKEIWRTPRSRYTTAIQPNELTGLIYETTYTGIYGVCPDSGKRLFEITSKSGFQFPAPPAITKGTIYLFCRDAYVFAIPHPRF